MHLARCQVQKPETPVQLYQRLAESGGQNADIARAMLRLLERIRAWPDERRVFALTSHAHLCLLAEDGDSSPWLVKFLACENAYYEVEYLMPERLAPWSGAYVVGIRGPEGENEAFEMILTAMEKSEGWAAA